MLHRLKEADIPSLVTIELATQESPWSQETFRRCFLLDAQGWVIECNHRIVGFLLFVSKAGEAHILNIAVHPDYQRRGYGQVLMENMIQESLATNLAVIYLEVRCSNDPAIALYKKMGFKQIDRRKNYYINAGLQEDALVFARHFDRIPLF